MSTILDALKRLEEERRTEKTQQAPLALTGQMPAPHSIRRWATGLILAGLVTAGVVAAIVWTNGGMSGKTISRNEPSPDPMVGTISPKDRKKSVSAAPDREELFGKSTIPAEVDPPPASRRSMSQERARLPSAAPLKTVPPSYSKQLQVKTNRQPRRSRVAAPAPHTAVTVDTGKTSSPHREAVNVLENKPDNRLPETSDSQPSPTQDPYTDAELLAGGTLRLQAISWSDIPSARVTIIDGRILREGQSVDGYIVVQIQPEVVIVGKGGKHWKLAYGRP